MIGNNQKQFWKYLNYMLKTKKDRGFTRQPFYCVRPLKKLSGVTYCRILTSQKSDTVGGFTMIELLTSVGLFMVVVVASSGLFLAVVQGNRKAVAIQNILDEGKFVLEIISRDIRTGVGFQPNALPGPQEQAPLEFISAGGERVCYRYNAGNLSIEKIVPATPGCGGTITQVTSSHIEVAHLRFLVSGTIPGDNIQPRITILMGISNKGNGAESVSSINLETTVSPRVLDIP